MTPYIRSRRDLATGVAGSVSRGYGARRQAECFNQWRFGRWNKPFSEPTRRRNVAWEQQIVFLGLQLQREREREFKCSNPPCWVYCTRNSWRAKNDIKHARRSRACCFRCPRTQ